MAETEKQSDIASLTVELLSAYLSNNTVPSAELAGLIQSTRAALTQETISVETEADKPTFTPAVTARKSLASPDHIVSLIDGKPYKTLKRHLTRHGLTPEPTASATVFRPAIRWWPRPSRPCAVRSRKKSGSGTGRLQTRPYQQML